VTHSFNVPQFRVFPCFPLNFIVVQVSNLILNYLSLVGSYELIAQIHCFQKIHQMSGWFTVLACVMYLVDEA
jgi:hypothetical protein